uniref:Sulfotransferase family-containing protein n=1 Tax=Strongyloides venezuelensis TaxID=75913 RepID=A0A0K0F669_STRVS
MIKFYIKFVVLLLTLYKFTKSQTQNNTIIRHHQYQFFITSINNKTVTNCDHVPREHICVPLKPRNWGTYIVAPAYKLNACAIGKNFSTMLIAMICYLFNSKKFKNHRHLFAHERWKKRSCIRKNEENTFERVSKKFNYKNKNVTDFIDNWNHLVIIRNPIERFISGFVHFCVRQPKENKENENCYGCKDDMVCFIEKLYDDIHTTVATDVWASLHLMNHFYPQSWMCQFSDYYDKYKILKYSSEKEGTKKFYKEITIYLKDINVPDHKIEFIKKQFLIKKVPHSTIDSSERKFYMKQLEKSDYIKDMLSRIYYSDFKMFNYNLPELKQYEDTITNIHSENITISNDNTNTTKV